MELHKVHFIRMYRLSRKLIIMAQHHRVHFTLKMLHLKVGIAGMDLNLHEKYRGCVINQPANRSENVDQHRIMIRTNDERWEIRDLKR